MHDLSAKNYPIAVRLPISRPLIDRIVKVEDFLTSLVKDLCEDSAKDFSVQQAFHVLNPSLIA